MVVVRQTCLVLPMETAQPVKLVRMELVELVPPTLIAIPVKRVTQVFVVVLARVRRTPIVRPARYVRPECVRLPLVPAQRIAIVWWAKTV